ncbi:MAG TPA: hypothetical protein VF930_10560, partial [Stellaceae bacterium]
ARHHVLPAGRAADLVVDADQDDRDEAGHGEDIVTARGANSKAGAAPYTVSSAAVRGGAFPSSFNARSWSEAAMTISSLAAAAFCSLTLLDSRRHSSACCRRYRASSDPMGAETTRQAITATTRQLRFGSARLAFGGA